MFAFGTVEKLFKNAAALKTIKSRTRVCVHHDTGAGQTLVGMSICPE